MPDEISEALIEAFDELVDLGRGHKVWFKGKTVIAIPGDREYVEELEIGGMQHSIQGALTFKKNDLPFAFAVGDEFAVAGGEFRVLDINTSDNNPLLNLAYQLITPPRFLPRFEDEESTTVISGGGADQDNLTPANQYWQVQVVQPATGGTIEIRHTDGSPITTETLQDGTRIEVHINLPESVTLVQWNGDLQQHANHLTFLHTVSNHLTISATTTPRALRIYTDLPAEGGIFNWQSGHTHPAGQPLTLTYQPPSEQHILSHFQINGTTVADGDSTSHGDISIAGGTITLSNPQVDLTLEAVLEHDCPQPVPTLGSGVVAPDPLPGPGEPATYTVNLPEGQELLRWELNGDEIPHSENGSVTITQPAGEFTLEAILQTIVFTLTIPTIAEGTILASNENPEYGEAVTFTFIPNPGYSDITTFYFSEGGDIPALENVGTWIADKSTEVSVDAYILTYTLNIAGDNLTAQLTETTSGDPLTNPIEHGTPVTITITPAQGYEFDSWETDPLIANTSHNPLNIILTGNATLTANVLESFSYIEELLIQDGAANLYSYSNPAILTEDQLLLNISGALIHNLIGNGSTFTTLRDALYPFWQQGYGGNDSLYAFAGRSDHTNLNEAIPESGVGFYRNTADSNRIDIAETLTTPRTQAAYESTNTITIDGKEVQIGVRFNSAIGFLPLPLIPFLNNGKAWADASFIPSTFQNGDLNNLRTVAQVKAALTTSGTPSSDHTNYQIGEDLQAVQDDTASFSDLIKDFNPYSIPIDMASIESAYGIDNTNRLSQIDFAIISTGLNITGNSIDGLNTANPSKIDGAFKLNLTLA